MQQSTKYFLLILLIAVFVVPSVAMAAWYNPFSWGVWNKVFHTNKVTPVSPAPIVGGDRDAHGCIGSAGYTWCEVKNKCLRTWEEKCEAIANPTASWKTYTNTRGGYSIAYPNDAKLDASNTTCVQIQKGKGDIFINNGSGEPCGGTTGLGIYDVKTSENININGQKYSATGWVENNVENGRTYRNGFLRFNFTNNVSVTYEVNMVNFEINLSEQQYNDAMSSVKEVLSTLKSI